jgi:hypothetical protein
MFEKLVLVVLQFVFTLESHFSWALGLENSGCILIIDEFLVLKPT